jgi:hypothetical protein
LQANNKQGVSNNRTDSVLPGDIVGMTKSAPPKDSKNDEATTSGGAAGQGNGGDAVWRQELTPQERALLSRYFK